MLKMVLDAAGYCFNLKGGRLTSSSFEKLFPKDWRTVEPNILKFTISIYFFL
ncbi:hypothetical protein ACS0TY_025652 [Phlomoides rotata]